MPTLNLIPRSTQIAQARARRIRGWAVLTAAGATACAIPLIADWTQQARAGELRLRNVQLQSDRDTARTQLREVSAQATEATLQLERANGLRAKRNWSGMLALLAECLPADCWLTSVATDPDTPSSVPDVRRPPVAAPGAKAEKPAPLVIEAPRKLRLHGQAADAALPLTFVSRLKESRVFRDVTLERTSRDPADNVGAFRFEVVCGW